MATKTLEGQLTGKPRPAPTTNSRRVWSNNPAVVLWSTMVGKKIVMAATGIVLVGFVVAHMLGNLKLFLGPQAIDTYAVFLRTMGRAPVPLWVAAVGLPHHIAGMCRAAHHRRGSADPDELVRTSAGLRDEAFDRDHLRGQNHALERCDPGPVRRLSFAAPGPRALRRLPARRIPAPVGLPQRRSRLFRSGTCRCSTSSRWAACACTWTTVPGSCSRHLAGLTPGPHLSSRTCRGGWRWWCLPGSSPCPSPCWPAGFIEA